MARNKDSRNTQSKNHGVKLTPITTPPAKARITNPADKLITSRITICLSLKE
ncbi:hypothetical protein D3C72_2507070 [compost metagenome]